MHLDLIRDTRRAFPHLEAPASVRTGRIWHCKYKTLRPLADLSHLKTLVIATYPDASLDIVGGLRYLSYLSILHLPKVHDLLPLASLDNLETLSLATLPSWDVSGKKQLVSSIEPLAQLPRLKHLELFGVVPRDHSLAVLESCQALRSARFSKFPKPKLPASFRQLGSPTVSTPSPLMRRPNHRMKLPGRGRRMAAGLALTSRVPQLMRER
jgi:hypothetical protein